LVPNFDGSTSDSSSSSPSLVFFEVVSLSDFFFGSSELFSVAGFSYKSLALVASSFPLAFF